ncbi:uncharacterized protein DS421_14g476670 [Arachis hypogaea]|nr:uncharacterized protein DS421_14g476670 [Arachis hypogaea]
MILLKRKKKEERKGREGKGDAGKGEGGRRGRRRGGCITATAAAAIGKGEGDLRGRGCRDEGAVTEREIREKRRKKITPNHVQSADAPPLHSVAAISLLLSNAVKNEGSQTPRGRSCSSHHSHRRWGCESPL